MMILYSDGSLLTIEDDNEERSRIKEDLATMQEVGTS